MDGGAIQRMKHPPTERRTAIETLRKIIKRGVDAPQINQDTLRFCAYRISVINGDCEAVQIIRQAVGLPNAEAIPLIQRAMEAAKVIAAPRAGMARVGKPPPNKGRRKVDDTPSEILERLSMHAADGCGILFRRPSGALDVGSRGFKMTKGLELLGVYDIRADARDMLADIKGAMA
jgi:hypothetical protein